MGILTHFPFGKSKNRLHGVYPNPLGTTNPCAIANHKETFSTTILKALWVINRLKIAKINSFECLLLQPRSALPAASPRVSSRVPSNGNDCLLSVQCITSKK